MSNPKVETSPPAEEAKAKLVTGSEAADNSIVYTAKEPGVEGNEISVTHVVPGGATASLGVVVAGTDITVNLGKADSTVNSTADDVKDAILASAPASELVAVSSVGASTGNGLVGALAKTNLSGGKAVKVSSVETTTVIKDPQAENAVQIPPEADATGRDELAVHARPTPIETINDF